MQYFIFIPKLPSERQIQVCFESFAVLFFNSYLFELRRYATEVKSLFKAFTICLLSCHSVAICMALASEDKLISILIFSVSCVYSIQNVECTGRGVQVLFLWHLFNLIIIPPPLHSTFLD